MRKVRYEVAKRGELTPDLGRVVPLGDEGGECALFLHQGRCHAVGSLCPHQNATLEAAEAENGIVICRRHGYRFDLKSGDCLTIGGYGIPVYGVVEENETIFVDTWEYDE